MEFGCEPVIMGDDVLSTLDNKNAICEPSEGAACRAATHCSLIEPLGASLSGVVRVPGDKSISHRAVLFSAMAEGVSHVSGVLDSEDVRSSMGAVSSLGARVDIFEQPDGSLAGEIEGWGSRGPKQPEEPIYCGNSGTTVRLLMGILAPWDISVELTGDDSLKRRPMRRIAKPLELMGAKVLPEDRSTLPLTVEGCANLTGIAYDSPVASAQLKTATLLAGLFAQGATTVIEPAPSRNHTELMLPEFGVPVKCSPGYASLEGLASMRAADIAVPGDPSSAAFLVCAAALKEGSSITVENVSLSEERIGFVRVLQRMGARVGVELLSEEGKEPSGNISISYVPNLRACEVEAQEVPSLVDEVPVLSLVAARAEGVTTFRGVGELRVKESDRLAAVIEGLAQLGVRAWAEGDDLYIEGSPEAEIPEGLVFDSRGDHRLAMTWSLVALLGCVPVWVRDFECVAISYPKFLTDMRKLAK